MEITPDTIRKVAHLARLRIEDSDVPLLQERLSSVLTWVGQLSEVSVEDVEPLSTPHKETMPLRADQVTEGDCLQAVLSGAPEDSDRMYAVPKVVE